MFEPMDNNNITMSPTNNNTNTKSPEADDFEIKTQIHGGSGGGKPLSYTNGVLKRHRPHHYFHNPLPHHAVVVTYRECLKNHAATLGGHALDGCGEFMPSPATNLTDPTSLKCAACGCHRNFHRREPEESISPPLQQLLLPQPLSTTASHVIEYQPHHRHHPPPPPPPPQPPVGDSPPPQSPPPISSSYYPSSAPHMLLALSTGLPTPLPAPENHPPPHPLPQQSTVGHIGTISATTPNGPKRFRTKFSPVQKEKMYQLAERVGWKMQKKDEDLVAQFCKDSGVDRSVFKVWMHNNKNTFLKKQLASDMNNATSGNSNGGLSLADQITPPHATIHNENLISSHHHHQSEGSENVGTHGSSSSS